MRGKCSQGEFDPVYEVHGKKIVHLFDFPHLLKSLRNNLLTSDLEFETNKFARWQNIIDFFKLDEGSQEIVPSCQKENRYLAHSEDTADLLLDVHELLI